MIQTVSYYCLVAFNRVPWLNIIRIILGPSLADRAISADAIFLNLVGLMAVYSIYLKTHSYIDLVLVFSLLGFVGMVCFSKFLARGKIFE